MLKRTPLFAIHQRLGARLVEFGGWEMPLQYSSIVAEHLTVREAAGAFDISHMGQIQIWGTGALDFLNTVLTNDVRKLAAGQGQYTLLCNERGGVIDDLYLYRVAEEGFLAVVNAARIDADLAWLLGQRHSYPAGDRVQLRHLGDTRAAVAVQGPQVAKFIDAAFPEGRAGHGAGLRLVDLKKNDIAQAWMGGSTIDIARTGYTGEDGFEIFAPAEWIEVVWDRLLQVGLSYGLKPCGLGARDTLRTEMGYPLYGHELDETTTPIEAGLRKFVATEKGRFVGREALEQQQADGVRKRCIAFLMTGRSAPPRPNYSIWSMGEDEKPIGRVVSGTSSPCLGTGIGMAYVLPGYATTGLPVAIEIRGQLYGAMVVARPIYKKPA
jgi:aminomethyltransferase